MGITYINPVTNQKSFLLEIHTYNWYDDTEKIHKFNTSLLGIRETGIWQIATD